MNQLADSTVVRWKLRGLHRFERWVLLVVAFTAALAALGTAGSAWDVAHRKRALRAHVDEERAILPERTRVLVDTMDGVILDAAKTPWPGDWIDPELENLEARAAFLTQSAVYVRAALPEISRLDAIGGATRRSDKDAFVLCLHRPAEAPIADHIEAAATRYWMGGGLFEDATHAVLPLDVLHRGLRPLSTAFRAEIDEANDHLYVRRLEEEYVDRTPNQLLMARTASNSDLLIVVIDELPEGMREPEVGKSLTATRRPAVLPLIEDAPHTIRTVVWSAAKQAVALRLRTKVNAAQFQLKNLGMEASHVQACQAAMAVRTETIAAR